MVSAEERHWRQVPKINVLQTRRGSPQKTMIFRGLLALVVLVGAFFIFSQRSTKADIDALVADKTVEIRGLQTRLNQQQQGINDLRAQINDLNAQREAINLAIQIVATNNIDWFAALDSLFSAQTSGVSFESVSAETDRAVLLVGGLAQDEGSKASLPSQFSNISKSLDFQSIIWTEDSIPPVFTAAFKVNQ